MKIKFSTEVTYFYLPTNSNSNSHIRAALPLFFFFCLYVCVINLSQASNLIQDDTIKATRELTVILLALQKLPLSMKIKDQKG